VSDNKKYYWLKLKRDFFKRHDMKIIESMDNGKDYVLFYLKLLLESIDHEGDLRFSETVPYNEKMLSVITDTNIDIVRSAVKVFSELGMMEQLEDGTLFMRHVENMLGSETSEAIRMRELRSKKKQILIPQGESVQCTETYENHTPELELELELELEKEDIPVNKISEKIGKKAQGSLLNVLLSDKEVDTLKNEYGDRSAISAIEYLSLYKAEKNYKTKSDYLTIRRWVIEAVRKKEGITVINKKAEKFCTHPTLSGPCGGRIKGSACIVCFTNYGINGDEV